MNRKKTSQFIQKSFNLPNNFKHRIFSEYPKNEIEALAFHRAAVNSSFLEKVLKNLKGNQNKEIISSAHGKIKTLLFALPFEGGSLDWPIATIENLLKELDDDVLVYIFTTQFSMDIHNGKGSESSWQIEKKLSKLQSTFPNQVKFLQVEQFDDFSYWVRDPFIVMNDGENQISFLEPYLFSRGCDASDSKKFFACQKGKLKDKDEEIADKIASNPNISPHFNGVKNVETGLIFHGGNTLVGADFILIGAEYFNLEEEKKKDWGKRIILKNSDFWKYLMNESNIFDEFQKWFSPSGEKKIIKIGAKKPKELDFTKPLTIDGVKYAMNWLPHGELQPFYHIDLFLTLLGKPDSNQKYQIFLAEIVNASGINSPKLYQRIINPWNNWILEIANQLRYLGFDVQFLPAPLTYFTTDSCERKWCIFTYNNSLVEITSTHRKIWMPTFNNAIGEKNKIVYAKELGYWDKVAIEKLRKHGIDVRPLMSYVPHLLMGGAIHCLTNYLERELEKEIHS